MADQPGVKARELSNSGVDLSLIYQNSESLTLQQTKTVFVLENIARATAVQPPQVQTKLQQEVEEVEGIVTVFQTLESTFFL